MYDILPGEFIYDNTSQSTRGKIHDVGETNSSRRSLFNSCLKPLHCPLFLEAAGDSLRCWLESGLQVGDIANPRAMIKIYNADDDDNIYTTLGVGVGGGNKEQDDRACLSGPLALSSKHHN